MPRNRMLSHLDEELVAAKRSLAYWREEKNVLAETAFRDHAAKMVKLRETEIQCIVEVQEDLLGLQDA